MSKIEYQGAGSLPAADASVAAGAGTQLVGRLRTADLVFAALALAGPLAATAGYTSFLIGYGSGMGTPWTFLVVMGVLLLFALAYGAMTRNVNRPGAFYSYITEGLGRRAGMGASFIILTSYITIGVGLYAFAGLSLHEFVVRLGGPDIAWWVYGLAYWVLTSGLAYFRVDLSAKVLGLLLLCEVVIVVLFNIFSFTGGRGDFTFEPLNPANFFSGNVGFAIVFAVALFTGFEATAIYREETIRPNKTIPRAAIIVVLVIGVFYALTSWAFIVGLGPGVAVQQAADDPAGVFFVVAIQYGGKFFADIASVLLLTSIFAAMLAIQNVATRYIYSLAVDGILPGKLGKAHPRYGSPARASVAASLAYLVFTGVLVLGGLTAVEIYSWFAGVASFTLILAMVLVSLSAVAYYYVGKGHGERKSFSNRVAPVLALVGLTIFAVLAQLNLGDITGGSPLLSTVMIVCAYGFFVAGFIYAEVLRRRSPLVYARIGRQ